MERRAQFFKKEEEDARLLDLCAAKRKEWAKHWQCNESVQNMEDKPWKNEELKKLEEASPTPKVRSGKSVETLQVKGRSGMRRIPPISSFGLDRRNKRRRNCGSLGEGGAEWKMAATSLHDDVLLDS